jgi:hypothetical protein
MDILEVRIPSVQWIIKTKHVPGDRTIQFHGLIQVPEPLHRKILASTSCTESKRIMVVDVDLILPESLHTDCNNNFALQTYTHSQLCTDSEPTYIYS